MLLIINLIVFMNHSTGINNYILNLCYFAGTIKTDKLPTLYLSGWETKFQGITWPVCDVDVYRCSQGVLDSY